MVFLIHTELRCTVNHTSDSGYCVQNPLKMYLHSDSFQAHATDTTIAAFIFFLSCPFYTAVLWKLCQNFTNKTSTKYERTVLKFGLFMRFAFDLRHSGRAVFEIVTQKATRFGITGGSCPM